MRHSLLVLLSLPILAISPRPPVPDPAIAGKTPHGLNIVDWTAIRAEYERHRHKAFPNPAGFQARNFRQQWLTQFDGRAFRVTPDAGSWTWGLQLRSYGFAGRERMVTGRSRMIADMGRVSYGWAGGLEEWYLNDTRGLEHGFTLRERPAGEGPLRFNLAVLGGLTPRLTATGMTFIDAAGAAVVKYGGLKAWDATGRALAARLEASAAGVRMVVEERGAQYPITVDPLAQQAYLKASNTGEGNFFGGSVAISGDTVVVGAPYESGGATGVNGNQSQGGAPQSGAAYVFVRAGITWTQQAYLKASNARAGDFFGWVAISDDLIVVGAPRSSSNAVGVNGGQNNNNADGGAAYIFVRNGGTWSQEAYLKPSTITRGFGGAVAVSGETAVVGAVGEDSSATGINGTSPRNEAYRSGAAYVFVRNGTAWSHQAYLKASNAEPNDLFGGSVAISGETIAVGAPGEASNARGVNGSQTDNSLPASGAAYIFARSGLSWTQQAYVKASNPDAGDSFGGSLGVSGDTLIVGASAEDSASFGVDGDQMSNAAIESGAAYVFARSGVSWSQQAYLKAHNPGVEDRFGRAVAVSGDTIVVGATFESSNASGVDGPASNNLARASGAAYVYIRNSGIWRYESYLKASNSETRDIFGIAVGASRDSVVVGAPQESSGATGVDRNQQDNSLPSSGAAYIFSTSGGSAANQPAGYWSFDQASGTVVADSSGNGADGALSGAASWTASGRSGAALNTNASPFAGTTGSVGLGSPPALSNLAKFTWAFWAYPTGDMVHASGPAIEKGSGSDVRKSFGFGPNGSSHPFAVSASVAGATYGALSVSAAGTYALNVGRIGR